MTKRRVATISLGLLGIVVLVFGAIEVFRGARSIFAGFDRRMQRSYESISIGTNKQATVRALGEPRVKSESFNLPQKHVFEHLFDAAERSGAVEYYQWINGMNWYYCIGFNAAGEVVVKGEGHS